MSGGFRLHVDFKGLTALVPLKSPQDELDAEHGEWLVALPELKRGKLIVEPSGESPQWRQWIAPHQSLLVVSDGSVRRSDKPSVLEFSLQGERFKVYEFENELLRIESGEASGVRTDPAEPGPIPGPGEERLLCWIPRLKRYAPEYSVFDGARHLTAKLGHALPRGSLSGLVRLDRGLLESIEVFRTLDGEPVPYDFVAPSGSKGQQALADGFRVTVEVPGTTAPLVFRDTSSVTARAIEVGPGEADPPSTVGVTIYNSELEEILGFENDPIAPGPDKDFYIFYTLSTAWPSVRLEELVLPHSRPEAGPGGGNKPCRSPQFAGLTS